MCVFPFAHQGSVVTYGRFTAQAPMDDCEPLEGAPEQEDRQQHLHSLAAREGVIYQHELL